MVHIPALNEIGTALGHEPEYPDDRDLHYLILFPEDYQKYGRDPKGNLALLVNEENAREVKRLAEEIIGEME